MLFRFFDSRRRNNVRCRPRSMRHSSGSKSFSHLGRRSLRLEPLEQRRLLATVFVDLDATGANTGADWTDAYTDLGDALGSAVPGDEIWVAEGTYIPTNGADRGVAFTLRSGVDIYGGFAGSETARHERDWTTHVTVLSGDIGAEGDMSDNSYHVVYASAVTDAALDGFTITAGNAKGVSWQERSGGGMRNDSSSSPMLTNVTFVGNAADFGAGMHNDGSSPTLINVTFIGNSAVYHGGGMRNDNSSSPTLTNVTFSGNSAAYYGGGMLNYYSSPTLANGILWGNTAATGPEIYDATGSTTAVTYSIVAEGWTGEGNVSEDPSFVRPPGPGDDGTWGTADDDYGDLRLGPDSPAIDAGNNEAVPDDLDDLDGDADTLEPIPLDLDALPRFVDVPGVPDTGVGTSPIVDMGAYEYQDQGQNEPPVADDRSVTVNEDTSEAILLTATDPNEDELTFSIVSNPSHGTLTDFDSETGTVVYTPHPDYSGDDSFTFKASDGMGESNIATVSVTVLSAKEQLVVIAEHVWDWVDEGAINKGQGNGLVSKLDGAIAQLADGRITPAVNKLDAFENQLQTLVRSDRLSPEQVGTLIALTEDAIHSALAGGGEAADAAFAVLNDRGILGDSPDDSLLNDLLAVGPSKRGTGRK